jgi:hypothetical protein
MNWRRRGGRLSGGIEENYENCMKTAGNMLSRRPSRIGKRNFLTLEDGSDTLSRNVGEGLPFDVA